MMLTMTLMQIQFDTLTKEKFHFSKSFSQPEGNQQTEQFYISTEKNKYQSKMWKKDLFHL